MSKRRHSFKILTLDGGGAKGFYSLGVLMELEALLGTRLNEKFDLIYGTSTGSIIGSLIALGYPVSEIFDLYREHVIKVVSAKSSADKSTALSVLANDIFQERGFSDFKTDVGIVTTNWTNEKPMIFKSNVKQAHGRSASFVSGFGCNISEAVQASCSAYPFFNRRNVTSEDGTSYELADGGYCANNPTLYAIADATEAFSIPRELIRVISIGVGNYPNPDPSLLSKMWWAKYLKSVQLLQKTLEINTQSMDQLMHLIFHDVSCLRISETFTKPELATDLFEHDLNKLNAIHLCGKNSFANFEKKISKFMKN